MNDVSFYLIKLLAGSGMMYLGYRLWLANSQMVGLVRWYLLVSLFLPAVLPFVAMADFSAHNNLPIIRVAIEPVTIVTEGATIPASFFQSLSPSMLMYLSVSVVLLFVLIFRVIRIFVIIKRSKSVMFNKLRLHLSWLKISPFSFFNNIFISYVLARRGHIRTVIVHEAAHIRQGHSYDVLFTEFICILQWFNPFVWLFRKAIHQNHEYLADRAVVKQSCNLANYKALLLESLTGISVPVVNNLNHSSLKMRFIMLNKPKTGLGVYVRTLAIVSFLLLTTVFLVLMFQKESFAMALVTDRELANEDTLSQPPVPYFQISFSSNNADKTQKSLFGDFKYPESARKAGKEGTVYISLMVDADGTASGHQIKRGFDKSCDEEALRVIRSWRWKPALRDGKPVSQEIVYPFKFTLSDNKNSDASTDQEVYNDETAAFVLVEVMPEFPGGDEARAAFLSESLTYPESAQKAGIQGTVFVSFVVETDGSITGVKVLRGIDKECDEAAMQAVKNMPKWKPGKQRGKTVRVAYNLPIKFQSGDVRSKESTPTVMSQPDEQGVYNVVETMPQFPGGDEARMKYLRENIVYPEAARNARTQGTVYVTFIVDEEGSISNPKILRGIGNGCDEVVLNLIRNMPQWKPGLQRGTPVKVQYNMPIKFVLNADKSVEKK